MLEGLQSEIYRTHFAVSQHTSFIVSCINVSFSGLLAVMFVSGEGWKNPWLSHTTRR